MYYNNYNYNAISALPALLFIAVIVTVVLTVMIYKRYISSSNVKLIDFQDPRSVAAFLRFDTLLIDRILKALYLFNAIGLPVFGFAISLGVCFVDFGSGLATLFFMAVGVLVGEVLLRLMYEAAMLRVVIARNTIAIKRALGVPEEASGDDILDTTAEPSVTSSEFVSQNAVMPEVDYAPNQLTSQAADGTPHCPNCGAPITRTDAKFCGCCGYQFR